MNERKHDDENGEVLHAVVVTLALEAIAVGLFFACTFVWFGILSGRI